MRSLTQSTAYNLMVLMTDSADHITGKTGLTLTITASKDGAAFASATPTVTERVNGWYSLALTTSHTDTLGDLALHLTGTGADPSDLVVQVKVAPATASALATVQTDTDDIQTRIPAALVSGRMDSSVGAMASGVLTATAIAADAITDAKVASDVTIASVTGAVGSVTGAVGSVTGNVGGNVVGSVASVTARVTANTDQLAGQTVTAAAGVTFPTSVASPTNITAGTITTVTNLTNAATSGDFTATMKTSIGTAVAASAVASVTGNLGGNVVGSVGSVVATVAANLTQILGTALTETSGQIAAAFKKFFNIATPAATMDHLVLVDTVTTATTATNLTNAATAGDFTATMKTSIGTAVAASAVASVTGNVGGNVTGSVGSIATGGIAATSFAAGAIDNAAIAADAIGASELAASGASEIASAVRTELATELARVDVAVSTRLADADYAAPPSAADITDAVWDELVADHAGSGSTGAALAAAGGSGDPWATALPGSYGSGTAGKIIGDNINAAITSRLATGTVSSDVTAIKAKTDSLTFTVANQVDANALKFAGQTITAAAGVTLPASVASPTNITAGTITTVTNLTNAATSGDLTATMKTSVTTAATAATPTAAAVTGSVGSVTGFTPANVGAIKVVTDKVATMLEADGGNFRYTEDSLAQAPSGGGSAPTAAEVADAVWDEAIADHQGAGSTGLALNDAGAGGNPWNAVIEGSYTAQDFLRIIGAAMAGKTFILRQGSGRALVTFRDLTDASDIIVGQSIRGARTIVTLDP